MARLIMFYGTECEHCEKMVPLVKKLEKEESVKVERIETWHNSTNKKKFEEMDKGECGGVPLFVNTNTGKKICGETSFEKLKTWALGK